MNLKPLTMFSSARELDSYVLETGQVSPSDIRSRVPIVVIDDEGFPAGGNLKTLGYNIVQIEDIRSVEEVKDYGIVLCDLMGVGPHFSGEKQGAGIIEEIRSHFPSTIVIAYTGSSLASGPARSAKAIADDIVKKDIDISEWRAKLDEYARQALDPRFVWNRLRKRLVEMNVDTKDILVVEDGYIRNYKKRRSNGEILERALKGVTMPQDARSLVRNLVTSAVFTVLMA